MTEMILQKNILAGGNAKTNLGDQVSHEKKRGKVFFEMTKD